MNIKHNLLNRTTRLHVIITNISLHPIFFFGGGDRERERKRDPEGEKREKERQKRDRGTERVEGKRTYQGLTFPTC